VRRSPYPVTVRRLAAALGLEDAARARLVASRSAEARVARQRDRLVWSEHGTRPEVEPPHLVAAYEGLAGETRYRLLETLRDFGWACLVQSGGLDVVQQRHATFYLLWAERVEPKLRRADQAAWTWRLEQEHDNLRVALQWMLEHGEAELGLRLAGALWRFWWVRGHLSEGRRWLERLLVVENRDSIQSATRARALGAAGMLAYDQGDYRRAVTLLDQSLVLFRELGDDRGVAWTLHSLARAAAEQGDDTQATGLLEESVALFRRLGDTSGIGWALHELARGPLTRGDDRAAEDLHRQSLGLFRQAADQGGIAWSLSHLGVDLSQRDDSAALILLEESLERFREQGDERATAWSLLQLGLVTRDRGDTDSASALLIESLVRYGDLGDRYGMAQLVGELGIVAWEQGQPERAVRLLGAAQAMRDDIGGRLLPRNQVPFERCIAAARACLGPETFAAIWVTGRALPPEQAVAEALDAGATQPPIEPLGWRLASRKAPRRGHRPHLTPVSGGVLSSEGS
jgi:tetratricopeptide (TPR) repeat protein